MKKRIQHPFSVITEVPRHKGDKRVVALLDAQVTIKEVLSSEAPVVIQVTSEGDASRDLRVPSEYRLYNDRLYSNSGERAQDWLDEAGRPVVSVSREEIQRILIEMERDRSHPTFPHAAYHVLKGILWNGGTPQQFQDAKKQMLDVPRLVDLSRPQFEDALHEWRLSAVKGAENVIVIDGHVWVQSPEPCYVFDGSIGLSVVATSFYEQIRHGHIESQEWRNLREMGRVFSCLDRDRAVAYAHRRLKESGVCFPFDSMEQIQVLASDVPYIDFQAHEIERLARLLVYDIASAIQSQSKSGVDIYYQLERDFLDAFMDLRDECSNIDALVGIGASTELALERMLNVLDVYTSQGKRYLSVMNLDQMHEIYSDWCNREVRLTSVSSLNI